MQFKQNSAGWLRYIHITKFNWALMTMLEVDQDEHWIHISRASIES